MILVAGEWRPYYLVDRITYGAAGTGTLEMPISASEEFQGEEIYFVVSSGSFNIEWIQNRGGTPFTNASSSDPISSTLFLTALDQRTYVGKFIIPLNIPANDAIKIYTTGGTNAATLDCIIKGKIRTL